MIDEDVDLSDLLGDDEAPPTVEDVEKLIDAATGVWSKENTIATLNRFGAYIETTEEGVIRVGALTNLQLGDAYAALEASKLVPGTTIIKDDTRITDTETGEVLGGEELALLLNMSQEQAQQFTISDRESAEWYIGRIVGIQKEIETFATMAKKMIASAMGHMRRLEEAYNGQLRTFCEAELQHERTKTGKLKRKYVPFMRGSVYFRKSGGVKLGDRTAVQEWVDRLDPSLLERFGVRCVRKWNVADLRKAVQAKMHIPGFDIAPEHELGTMRIGTDKPWSPTKVKNMLSDITEALPMHDDEEGGNE